jgi:hypothetical protein
MHLNRRWNGEPGIPAKFELGSKSAALYGLSTDRGETRNVALLHPDVRAQIEPIMNRAQDDPPYRRAPYRARARRSS